MNLDGAVRIDLDLVLEASECGYMHDSYGDAAWRQCARFLLAQGHNAPEAAAIMLSKHMRWADDSQGRGIGKGTNSAAFKRYYIRATHGGDWWRLEGERMAYETFGDNDDWEGRGYDAR
jgi:hypothetical protein